MLSIEVPLPHPHPSTVQSATHAFSSAASRVPLPLQEAVLHLRTEEFAVPPSPNCSWGGRAGQDWRGDRVQCSLTLPAIALLVPLGQAVAQDGHKQQRQPHAENQAQSADGFVTCRKRYSLLEPAPANHLHASFPTAQPRDGAPRVLSECLLSELLEST